MTSRLEIAAYLSGTLAEGRPEAIERAAGWLVETGRAREARYLARDVARVLAARGYLWARITTAHPLSDATRQVVEDYLKREMNAREIELETRIDPTVIGGMYLETPSATLDATVKKRLATLVTGATV